MRFTVILLIGLLPLQGISASPETFRQAKKIISKIYAENPISFYCDCPYKKTNGKLRVDWKVLKGSEHLKSGKRRNGKVIYN